jgi:hypothetical protein
MTQTLRSLNTPKWQTLEACLYVICAPSDAAKGEQMSEIIPAVVQIAQRFDQPAIKQSIIRFIGLYAKFLGKTNGDIVVWALNYVMDNVQGENLQASKSFVNICEACGRLENGMTGHVWEKLAEACVNQMNVLPVSFNGSKF